MAELKTTETNASVIEFLAQVADEKRRQDCLAVLDLMKEVTQTEPKMWGSSIVGFGHYHYRYASGREGDWFLVGFSPRKRDLTLYIMSGFDKYDELLGRLGKYNKGKACLYIKKLEDVDQSVLKELVQLSVEHMAS
jgi:hypothetical protein